MDLLTSAAPLAAFLDSPARQPTLGLVHGRRRVGKSTTVYRAAVARRGFYWEATRGETAVHLARLGEALGTHLGTGRLALGDWTEALRQLLALGAAGPTPVVLDEFGYLLEAHPTLDSIVAHVLGSATRGAAPGGQARLVLCGSAMAMMGALTAGEAPLRGRAGMELVLHPLDFRGARAVLEVPGPPELALRLHSVIGGIIGYGTDMVDHDLPHDLDDFPRWVAQRVLSPAATLHHEATTLLAEEPSLAGASPTLHRSILGAIAVGSVTAGAIANRLRRSVPNLDPALKRLIAAGFVVRHEDPLRSQRPRYAVGDPFLLFHYAVLEPHGWLLRERDPREVWAHPLEATFDARVRGPVFEEVCRSWVRRHADPETLGGTPQFVGPSSAFVGGQERELDVVIASGGSAAPAERTVLALGEAKAGERLQERHLVRLDESRAALGPRASGARLLLFGRDFSADLRRSARRRGDVELVDLERLYGD